MFTAVTERYDAPRILFERCQIELAQHLSCSQDFLEYGLQLLLCTQVGR
jgi:hypothetical protein